MQYFCYHRRRPHDFSQNISFGDYLFVYASGDNNIVNLIQPNPDNSDTSEGYMPDDDNWNLKMARSVINMIIAVGVNMKYMMTLSLCLMNLNKILEINIYIWIS